VVLEDVDVVVDDDVEVVVVVGGGPEDTAMSTVEPGVTLAPVPGFEATTMPGAYWDEATEVTLPTTRPALARVCPATT